MIRHVNAMQIENLPKTPPPHHVGSDLSEQNVRMNSHLRNSKAQGGLFGEDEA